MIFEIKGKREIGRKFLGSVFEPFLYIGLSFAILHSKGKDDNLIERLQSCVTGCARTLAPSLINLPFILSIPADFEGSTLFKRSTLREETFAGRKCCVRNFCGIYFLDFVLFRKNKFQKYRRKFVHPQK